MAAAALRRRRTLKPAPRQAPAAPALLGGFHDVRGRIILGTPAPAACPFCNGTEAIRVHSLGSARAAPYHVSCEKCHADGPGALSRTQAAMLWNQRGVTDASRMYRWLCGPGEA